MLKKKLDYITESFSKLSKEFHLEDFDSTLTAYDGIYLPFPFEDKLEIDIDHLISYLEEIDSLTIHDYNRVTTDTFTQRVISISDFSKILYLDGLETEFENGIKILVTFEPFLIGLAASRNLEFNRHHPPCSSHVAIELKYSSINTRLSFDEEEKLIKSFFFELSHTHKIGFEFSSYKYNELSLTEDMYLDYGSPLEDYNIGMDMFFKANQSLSNDIKFLSYYKIFEYFAPFCSRIDAYDAMRKKMDSSKLINIDAKFISSIFELSKSYENSLRDKELIKSVINKTFDLIDIYDFLPLVIRQKQLKTVSLNYTSSRETIDRAINDLGNILYSTRNSIVHSKSNYNSNGLECREDDLAQLNYFMHMACYSTIKWYNRLPSHLKME